MKTLRTRLKLDPDLLNQYVDLLRHLDSPSCNLSTDLLETINEVNAAGQNHPAEFARAREVFNRLYANRKDKHGR